MILSIQDLKKRYNNKEKSTPWEKARKTSAVKIRYGIDFFANHECSAYHKKGRKSCSYNKKKQRAKNALYASRLQV